MNLHKLFGKRKQAPKAKPVQAPSVLNAGRIAGTWSERLDGVFECGVDFAGKSILDVGCNIGIIGYEISKHAPSLYRGVDIDAPSIEFSRRLFSAIAVESRFDVLDLSDVARVREYVARPYDIVLYLAVDQHLRQQNAAAADAVAALLFEHCTESLLFRGPPPSAEYIEAQARRSNFTVRYRAHMAGTVFPLIRFDRT